MCFLTPNVTAKFLPVSIAGGFNMQVSRYETFAIFDQYLVTSRRQHEVHQ